MRLTWLDRANPDPHDVAEAVALAEAARAADRPYRPVQTVSMFLGRLRHGWDGEPPEVAVARDGHGRIIGVVELVLPRRDNTHLAIVFPVTHPAVRSQQVLPQLIEAASERARGEGRKVVLVITLDRPDLESMATAMGFERAYTDIERRQDLRAADWAELDAHYAAAEERAAAYDLVRITPAVPDSMLAAVAALTSAINDAPTENLDVEDEVFTPERIRDFEAASVGRGRRLYRLLARHRESGELGGHTIVAIENEQPWHGYQYDTSVLAAHRGRRLGMLLKIGMMRWLREAEPQLRFIDTENAASNDHMIRVNELLRYQIMNSEAGWQKNLV
ncbi:MAG TPA: GNAT family N-acetyltransferase [Jiangellaceae bacterium]